MMSITRTITLASLLFITISTQAEVFRFTGASDQNYTNPDNWNPSFPGIIVSEEDQVIIEADAIFDGPLLLINGGFRIESRAMLDATQAHLQLTPGASLDLRGTLLLQSLISESNVMVHAWAKLKLQDFSAESNSETMIMSLGDVKVMHDLSISGRIDLYGTLTVAGNLTHSGQFLVMASALLEAESGIIMETDTSFYYHPEATLFVGKRHE